MNRPKKQINLPALPDSWNRLSSRELEEVNRLMAVRNAELGYREEQAADRRFKLRCFLLFLRLKVARNAVKDEKGEWCFLFRRKGVLRFREAIPMRAWQVNQWIDDRLGFLDRPYGRLVSPYTFVRFRLGTVRMKAPDDLLGDVTFHQYLTAQNALDACWETEEVIRQLAARGGTRKALREQEKKAERLRCRFLAALFTRPARETGEIREGRYVRSRKRTVWAYSDGQAERNAKYFRRAEKRMFPVMAQFFQSVQEYYAGIYPDLYTGKKSGKKAYSQLKVEVEMVNSIMKWQGFADYDAVYDAEAVRILGLMNAMSKEAKEIEKMNERMRNK